MISLKQKKPRAADHKSQGDIVVGGFRHAPLRKIRLTIPVSEPRTTVGAYATDQALVARLLQGDAAAWELFVDRFGGLVRNRVQRVAATCGLTSDGATADDLVADVFAALLVNQSASLRCYAGRSSLSTYLTVIATRVTVKRSLRKQSTEVAISEPSTIADQRSNEPLCSLVDQESVSQLRIAMDQLPDRQKDLLQLFHVEGQSYQEISRQLNIPVGSIGPTLQRAQQRLRELMQ